MVYMLIGYWPGETHTDRDYRRRRLRDFGAVPYPMPFRRTSDLLAFQRWVIGAYDKTIPWTEWVDARGQPRNLTRYSHQGYLPGARRLDILRDDPAALPQACPPRTAGLQS
jgi:hypothetical protein